MNPVSIHYTPQGLSNISTCMAIILEPRHSFGMLPPLSPSSKAKCTFGMDVPPSSSPEAAKHTFGMDTPPSSSPEAAKHTFGLDAPPSPSPEPAQPKSTFGIDVTPSPSPEADYTLNIDISPSPSPEPRQDSEMGVTPSPSQEKGHDFGPRATLSPSPVPEHESNTGTSPPTESKRPSGSLSKARGMSHILALMCILLPSMQFGNGESQRHLQKTANRRSYVSSERCINKSMATFSTFISCR